MTGAPLQEDEEEALAREPGAEGVEEEKEEEGEGGIQSPYDPSRTQIITRQQSIDSLIRRIKYGEIDMAPDFQRKAGLWSPAKKSRLIESLLIRIPLPVFYFDGSDENRWLVVDGLQRLTTFQSFVVDKTLRLTGLEYLKEYEGRAFDDLPRDLQRRIEETQVTLHIIQAGSPPEVKYNIFQRINTGGLVLTPQEIRHALNQGQVTKFLDRLARTEEFRRATAGSISPQRMLDCEMALRFLSFSITPYTSYAEGNVDLFLNHHMKLLNERAGEELDRLEQRFKHAMSAAHTLFGNDAFRKRLARGAGRHPINKALFEAWSVELGKRSPEEIATLAGRREILIDGFIALCNQPDFLQAVSQGTGDVNKVKLRFSAIEGLIARVLAGGAA